MIPTPRGRHDLAAWLRWQENAHSKAWDLGLTRIGQVWQALGAPRIARRIVTVAGTNGKGSTVAFMENLCLAHGVSVASLTSPHLLDYRERIRFDGEKVSAQALCEAFDAIDAARGDVSLTYFEWNALAAFYLMVQAQPQVAVLEVGLGGRLDAVNLIDADACIFTRIGLDHTDWLGDTLDKIASEKAGILRAGQHAAFADAHMPQALHDAAAALDIVPWQFGQDLQVCAEGEHLHVRVPHFAGEIDAPPHMPGAHQYGHLAAVLAVFTQWFAADIAALNRAMHAVRVTGRLMPLTRKDGDWLIDVAHNADSAEVLARHLQTLRQRYGRIIVLCGMLRDKDQQAVFAALKAVVDQWVLTGLPGERGTMADTLGEAAEAVGVPPAKLLLCADVPAALEHMREVAGKDDLHVVMGSFVTVSQVLERFEYD